MEENGLKEKYQETILKIQGTEILWKDPTKAGVVSTKRARQHLERELAAWQEVSGYGDLTKMSRLTRRDTRLRAWEERRQVQGGICYSGAVCCTSTHLLERRWHFSGFKTSLFKVSFPLGDTLEGIIPFPYLLTRYLLTNVTWKLFGWLCIESFAALRRKITTNLLFLGLCRVHMPGHGLPSFKRQITVFLTWFTSDSSLPLTACGFSALTLPTETRLAHDLWSNLNSFIFLMTTRGDSNVQVFSKVFPVVWHHGYFSGTISTFDQFFFPLSHAKTKYIILIITIFNNLKLSILPQHVV